MGPLAVAGVQAQETTANTTTTEGNATAANTTESTNGSVSVTMQRQTVATGANVTVRSATLPEGGYVVLHGYALTLAGQREESAIAVSEYLEPGSYQNLTIPVDNGVPGVYSNQSRLNGSQNISAVAYRESNGNQRFEQFTTGNDSVYEPQQVALSTGYVLVERTQNAAIPSAALRFTDQTSNGTTVTVASTKLPDGGFVAIHDSSYLPPENDTFGSIIGVGRYVEPNESAKQVTIELYDVPGRSLNRSRLGDNSTLVAVPYRDTNGNQQYDYYQSDGLRDSAYINRSGESPEVIVDRASIGVNGSGQGETTPQNTTNPSGGQPIEIGVVDPNQGIFGTISSLLNGPVFDFFIGAAFILFVGFIAYQVKS
ncbi:DUF7282 domain-containing protein [Halococcus saccharolyticus]|uniref:DUF7282 domain-containing protein n=1 Tax=Halococcus saccharolyticus DSM 5350 TaxID=1227455 RepID=M0MCQ0_9EURY|nr:hypothetical protein [Halococcus saccharolyticus]EMA43527.1 hypothetical protein C449_13237 [Halococcus saccharolyticus DSM 5350]